MANIQCKMCGGINEIQDGVTSGVCQYCGSLTTFPKFSDEQTEHLYSRAEHFRQKNDFDKAVATYESILNRNSEDPEAYWGLVISRYGIKYVEDPATHKRIPTCHRVQYESILADSDYQNALKYASGSDREIYEKEAQRISEIQKGILRISAQEKPYDVFICYKETTDGGTRTKDSTIAQDIYYQLTNQGLKVFFSRITLEDKLGQQYEPYIFAALNSAKVMLVIGSKREYFDAVWVKNEWSRFLALMKKDRSKLLIPCFKDMDPYDIPEELSMFQSQDMSKIGFIQDILHGIMKVVDAGQNETKTPAMPTVTAGANNDKIMRRITILMEQQDWDKARDYCEKLLENDPENPELYFLLCLIGKRIPNEKALLNSTQDISEDWNFRMAMKFASPDRKRQLETIQQDLMYRTYLSRCMENNHISSESDLPQCKTPLSEDKNFQMALKYASPERKKQLEEILTQQMHCYLQACLIANSVSSESELAHVNNPLADDELFQAALKIATQDQKKELLQIQYDQADYFLNNLKEELGVSSFEQAAVPLGSDVQFQTALKSASPERQEELRDIQERQFEYFLGKSMESNRVFSENELAQINTPLAEDNDFNTALRCASPEKKKALKQIMDQQTDHFLDQCLKENGVIALEQSPKPLSEDCYFQAAMRNASLERKIELEQIPLKQYNYFLKKCLEKHNAKNVNELIYCKTKLTDDPDFEIARECLRKNTWDFESSSSVALDDILCRQRRELEKPSERLILLVMFSLIPLILGIYMFQKFQKSMNYISTIKEYQEAAEQGNVEAQFNLAVCYENGNGVKKDISEAVKWYYKAAENGYAGGRDRLEVLAINGYAEAQKALYALNE